MDNLIYFTNLIKPMYLCWYSNMGTVHRLPGMCLPWPVELLRWGMPPAGARMGWFALISFCCCFQKGSSPSQLLRPLIRFLSQQQPPQAVSAQTWMSILSSSWQLLLPVPNTFFLSGCPPRCSVGCSTRVQRQAEKAGSAQSGAWDGEWFQSFQGVKMDTSHRLTGKGQEVIDASYNKRSNL